MHRRRTKKIGEEEDDHVFVRRSLHPWIYTVPHHYSDITVFTDGSLQSQHNEINPER